LQVTAVEVDAAHLRLIGDAKRALALDNLMVRRHRMARADARSTAARR
jgi:hypothetical protein